MSLGASNISSHLACCCSLRQNLPFANIASDGGGIRGYSTLLIIKELMNVIGEIEIQRDGAARSSYHPLSFVPNKGSQIPQDARSQPSVRYLPAHYFDYIGQCFLCLTYKTR
jgi:hypothetical protein